MYDAVIVFPTKYVSELLSEIPDVYRSWHHSV